MMFSFWPKNPLHCISIVFTPPEINLKADYYSGSFPYGWKYTIFRMLMVLEINLKADC